MNIWITGASTGIGKSVALKLAKKTHKIFITARSENNLYDISETAKSFDGKIIPMQGDVTDKKRMADIVEDIETNHGALDMVILNAGTYTPDELEKFTLEIFEKHHDLNVRGVMYALYPALQKFKARKKGHIAIVGSVAGFRGLPRSISYGSSKAALINMAEALYIECKPYNIKVQIVNPGFVKTPLTDKNDFDMPMLMDVDDASDAFIKGLESNRFEINFPWLFCHIKKTIDLLPNRIYLWLMGMVKP